MKLGLAMLAPLALTGTAALAQTGTPGWDGHGPGMMGHGGWGGWFMGPVMMLVFLVLLAGAVALILRLIGGDRARREDGAADRSLAILRERFARGEIDAEEFEARRRALGE